jgi:hypothetical protein
MALPLADLRGPIRALFSDIDGTLTTAGRIEASTYTALERLGDAGVPVVLVPASRRRGQAFMSSRWRRWHRGGGVTWVRGKRLSRLPALARGRRRMLETYAEVAAKVPGARLSTDSKYREVDLAIDWNEEASLSAADADNVVAMIRKAGFTASRSSVHVNFGPPHFDKLSACVTVIRQVLKGDGNDLDGYAFVGDALNDAPMFGGFPKSIGVANVRAWWDELSFKPAYLSEAAEGAGLREVVEHVLKVAKG